MVVNQLLKSLRGLTFMKKLIPPILLFAILFSCSKDEKYPVVQLQGAYNGTFTYAGETLGTITNPVTVTFNNTEYSSTAGENRFPAGGNGTYSLHESGDSISFTDLNIYTADFDWGLILAGEYAIYEKDNQIVIERISRTGISYSYRLNKVKK